MKRFGVALILFSQLLFGLAVQPLNAASIAATVNDKVITKRDLSHRVKLTLLSMNMSQTNENVSKVQEQVLEAMIQDQIKLQLAEEFQMEIDPHQIQSAIRNIERQNNMGEGDFAKMMASKGIPFYIMQDQVKAQLIWNEYIRARFANMVQVSEAEVEKALAELKHGTREKRFQLAEIVLYADDKNTMSKRRSQANNIVAQVKQGAPFSMLANQVSQAPSSVNGGVIGWVAESKLSDELRKVIAATSEGNVTKPIEMKNGVRIYYVIDTLMPGQFSKPKSTITFKQVFVPNPEDAFAFEIEDNLKQVASISQQIRSCNVVEKLVKSKNGTVQFVQSLPLQNLPGPIKDILSKTAVNRGSKPVYTGNGAMFFVVCDRKTSNPKEPDADMMRAQLVDQKLQNISEQEIRTRLGGAHIDRRG